MGRVVLIMVGVSTGVLIGIAAFAVLDDDDPRPLIGPGEAVVTEFPAVEHDDQAAVGLLEAWARWRSATFYARGSWERRLDGGGAPLSGQVLTVQDPPRRVVVRLGALVELIDGSSRSCDSDVDGALPPACGLAESGLSYEDRVTAELTVVEDYVLGTGRLFDVGPGDSDGCYRAENRALQPAAPWGLWAEFCFDEASGAMERARIRRESAVDREFMFEVRAEVTETDFVLG